MQGVVHIANTALRSAVKLVFRQQKSMAYASHIMAHMQSSIDSLNQEIFLHIQEIVEKTFPDHVCMQTLKPMPKDSPMTWHLLPLDGSHNFLYGSTYFTLGLGVQYQGILQHAAIYTPLNDRLWSATKGAGTLCNERRVRLPKYCPSLKQAIIAIDDHASLPTKMQQNLIEQSVQIRQYGSQALAMLEVSQGYCHSFVSSQELLWQLHPASLILQEAGAFIANFQGRPLTTHAPILAGHGKLLPQLSNLLDSSS